MMEFDELAGKISNILNASYSKVWGALNLYSAMLEKLQEPEVRGEKVVKKYGPPDLLAKCSINDAGLHTQLEVKKVALGEDYKILIRNIKPKTSVPKKYIRPRLAFSS